MKTKKPIIIGTRPSKLALWQADFVKSLLQKRTERPIELKKITTKGDKILDRSLVEVGGKGLFLKEIEDELLAGSVDLAVHSMKDVPYQLPEKLLMAAILPREDPSDAWIGSGNRKIEDLPDGAVVGTTSLRRQIQLKKKFPGLVFKDLRGNVDTRLAKLDHGDFDGIVLACAGLKRLGLGARITQSLDIVPAVAQGAIGVECREGDDEIFELLSPLNDESTARCVALERHFLKKVEGSCQTPLGCHVTAHAKYEKKFALRCFLSKPDGSDHFEKHLEGKWEQGETLVDGLFT